MTARDNTLLPGEPPTQMPEPHRACGASMAPADLKVVSCHGSSLVYGEPAAHVVPGGGSFPPPGPYRIVRPQLAWCRHSEPARPHQLLRCGAAGEHGARAG